MTYLDYLEKKVLLERLVIGLEEPVLVKGLGELQAKIDSGNGGYNVIHGTDLHQQGNQLTFTTKDKFDHETKMTATVVDDIDVNMGGGNIEKRPVIELDIKFANEDYKKIPFSVSDRSTNTHPILISKGFVENELKALIDVGATNISNDGIDVVYGEGVGGMIKGVANGITKTAGDIKRGMQNFGNAYNNTMNGIGKFGDWLAGDAKMSEWTPTAKGIKDNLKKATMGIYSATGLRSIHKAAARLVNGMSLNTEDPKEILKKLKSNATIKEKFEEAQATENTIFSEEKIKYPRPIPVFNFAFQKGKIGSKNYVKGMEGEAKKFKKAISQAKEGVKSRKRDIDDKNLGEDDTQKHIEDDTQKEQVNDSFIYNNAILILEDDNTNVNQVDNQQEVSDEEVQEMELQFQNLSEFFLWFVPVNKLAKDSSNHDTLRGQFSDKILSGSLDDVFAKVYQTDKPLNPKSFDEIIPKIVSEIYDKDKNGWLVGFFVLCYAKTPENPINRDYFIIDNPDAIVFKKDSKVVADEKQREDDIKTFSEKLKKDIPNVENLNQNPTISISDIETLGQGGQQDNFLQEILSNKDTMLNSYRLLNAVKQNPNSRNSDKYVEELNKWVAQENPKHVLSKSDLGKQLLPKLVDENGNLTVQDFNSLVQTCFENEELKKIVLDYTTSEDEEEPWWNQCDDEWIREKMQLMKNNGYI